MKTSERNRAMSALASSLPGIDECAYHTFNRDPLKPLLEWGAPESPWLFFGRDPGAKEVQHQIPFIGQGGQKIRRGLSAAFYQRDLLDFEESIAIGRGCFWANTVPYKPIGNKAWSQQTKRLFHPYVSDLLINEWRGEHVLTLGRVAFFWFGLLDRALHKKLSLIWKQDDLFESSYPITLQGPDGRTKVVHLHPLPHPSPLNARWAKRFPSLLQTRIQQLQIVPSPSFTGVNT